MNTLKRPDYSLDYSRFPVLYNCANLTAGVLKMKLVIQRVKQASVSVDGNLVSKINEGLMVLVGIHKRDTKDDLEECLTKIRTLKLFHDEGQPRWTGSLEDRKDLQLLLVSQFTLYGNPNNGKKVDFNDAMGGDAALAMFNDMVEKARLLLGEGRVHTGAFGQYMQVSLTNDGPVTIIFESKSFQKQTPVVSEVKGANLIN